MALVFMDGFDFYPTVSQKGWVIDYMRFTTTANNVRNGRAALEFYQGGYSTLYRSLPSNMKTVVVGMACKFSSVPNNWYLFNFRDESTNQVRIRFNSAGTISAYRNATLLGTSSAVVVAGQYDYYEVKAVIDNSAGSVEVHRNGESVLSLTGIDTQESANAYCNIFEIFKVPAATSWVDDLYIDDTDFNGDTKIVTIYPNGAGDDANWTPSAGSNYACVDETPFNSDTDYVSTATNNLVDTYAFGDVPAGGTVLGVMVNVIARADDASAVSVAPIVKPGSTKHVGTTRLLTQTYLPYYEIFNTNPDTSAAWTINEVNATKFGIKSVI